MNNEPWQTEQSLTLVHLLLMSYKNSYGEDLLIPSRNLHSKKEQGARLFKTKNPVLAHDNGKDPCLNYANSAALLLWKKCWNEMIGMPSRLTTPNKEQEQRKKAFTKVTTQYAIKNYQGIRVNSQGELFIIKNARIWTILDEANNVVGQAATFNSWWKL